MSEQRRRFQAVGSNGDAIYKLRTLLRRIERRGWGSPEEQLQIRECQAQLKALRQTINEGTQNA